LEVVRRFEAVFRKQSMSLLMLLLVILLPMLAASLLGFRATCAVGRGLGAVSPLYPLGVALAAPSVEPQVVPWLLIESEVSLDSTGRMFLVLTAIVWLAAGIFALGYHHADARRNRFWAFFLFTMTGNFGLVLAADMLSFYFFFGLMSFASFGLIIHDGTTEVLRAGRVYLVLVVTGEILLFMAFLGAAAMARSFRFSEVQDALAASPTSGLILGFVLFGFGVKAGLVPLHVWLPLAHPAAPTAASAVLSGAMIKAGLLGWLRTMPLGESNWEWLGATAMVLGLTAIYGAALVGIFQTHPKVILAYSSISQMGILTSAVGAGLAVQQAWPALLGAILFHSLHHALAKGALFLGVGVVSRRAVSTRYRLILGIGLLLPALALAGAPGTSGAIGKSAVKYALPDSMPLSASLVQSLLAWSAVGTSLLMARYLWQLRFGAGIRNSRSKTDVQESAGGPTWALCWGWGILVISSIAIVGLGWAPSYRAIAMQSLSLSSQWAATWPILLAILLSTIVWFARDWVRRTDRWSPPAGDLLVPALYLLLAVPVATRQMGAFVRRLPARGIGPAAPELAGAKPTEKPWQDVGGILRWMEGCLAEWRYAGLAVLALLAIFFWLLLP
jgi:formate hydrogenlyase subunit 3/multisubunit Na+/H+ antiporter MnhD subunit